MLVAARRLDNLTERTMKTKLLAAFLALSLAGLAGPATAQRTFDNEISVFGTYDDVDEPVDLETSSIYFQYGRFVSPRLVATGTLSRTSIKGAGADARSLAVLGGVKYYFADVRAQNLVPFADAAIGFADSETPGRSGTDLTWQAGGGVALFISERTSIDAALRLYNTDTDARTKGLRAFVGLTTRF
jgi:hypothetical protein